MPWKNLIVTFLVTFIILASGFYIFIVLLDPYDNVPFSLSSAREPVSTNQRFAYPSLARKSEFNSALIGTSTLRLLMPDRLNQITDGNWVNLAMNSATAYEQIEILKLFLNNHKDVDHIVVGIDDAWCRTGKTIQKYTFRPFPPWMYDDNRWNDLFFLFNDKALEDAVRLLEYWTGKRQAKYDRTGYRDFSIDFGEYNLARAQEKLGIDGKAEVLEDHILSPITAAKRANKRFPSHELLAEIARYRNFKNISLIFMPLNAHYLAKSIDHYRACKGSVLQQIAAYGWGEPIDLMVINSLTKSTSNFWDPLHHTTAVAKVIEKEISQSSP